MSKIKKYPFDKNKLNLIKNDDFGTDWPVVYMIENEKEMYIGETVDVYNRTQQHLDDERRKELKNIHVISDEEFNKSATLDIESSLIQYISADGKFLLQNGNGGLSNHNYYDRQKYQAKFEILWNELKEKGLVTKDLIEIRNSEIFKYSPYKALTDDQISIVESILDYLKKDLNETFIIKGGPGTGKTILAIYLIKTLIEFEETSHLKVALVVPMTSLRKTLQQVFKGIKNLKSNMVIGPAEVIRQEYDLLIVDEAHRLKKRKNITNYESFDKVNQILGFGLEGTELDWILSRSKCQILFFDKDQSVRPSDIHFTKFESLKHTDFNLKTQKRIGEDGEGDYYINYINSIFDQFKIEDKNFKKYDFRIFENLDEMVKAIKEKEKEFGLARLISGYAWEWQSKDNPDKYDIEVGNVKLRWNSTNQNWVNSKNAINEVGCIHTVQGYDLNFAGVIIGPELSYNPYTKQFEIHAEHYKDRNGRQGVEDLEELKRYIINIYKTLLTRAIKGTYVYIFDENLRNLFEQNLK